MKMKMKKRLVGTPASRHRRRSPAARCPLHRCVSTSPRGGEDAVRPGERLEEDDDDDGRADGEGSGQTDAAGLVLPLSLPLPFVRSHIQVPFAKICERAPSTRTSPYIHAKTSLLVDGSDLADVRPCTFTKKRVQCLEWRCSDVGRRNSNRVDRRDTGRSPQRSWPAFTHHSLSLSLSFSKIKQTTRTNFLKWWVAPAAALGPPNYRLFFSLPLWSCQSRNELS